MNIDLIMKVSEGNPGALGFINGLLNEGREDLIERLLEEGVTGESLYLRAKDQAYIAAMTAGDTEVRTYADVAEAVLDLD
jgi:hypothetical protein